MITKNKKLRKKRDWEQPVVVLVFVALSLGLIGLLIFSNFRINQRRGELLKQIDDLDGEIRLLQENNTQLKEGIDETQKDSHWEEKIREQGYKKPGEEQVVVLPPADKEEKTLENEQSFWQKLLSKVGF